MNGHLEKAFIKLKDESALLECMFNPREFTITKSGTWHKTPTRGSRSAPQPEFIGPNARTMQMELFFDEWEKSTSGDVSSAVNTLLEWMNPTQTSHSDNKPNPPIVVFHWGQKAYFDAYVKQVSAKYTMFRHDGTPARATANVSFEEIPAEPQRGNPTSGGAAGKRSHIVSGGDTLHSIAYKEYGDASLWRGLAAANGIDDPLRVAPGRTLLIPRGDAAAELS